MRESVCVTESENVQRRLREREKASERERKTHTHRERERESTYDASVKGHDELGEERGEARDAAALVRFAFDLLL